jgi:phosphate transport system permease protein
VNAERRGRLRTHSRFDKALETAFRWGSGLTALASVGVLVAIALVLAQKATPTFELYGWGLLVGTNWDATPVSGGPGIFGVLPLIWGTLVTSLLALLLGVPVSLGIAMFLSESAPAWLRTPLAALVELLAAVPSVVFGLWGLFVLVPVMRFTIDPVVQGILRPIPVVGAAFAGQSPGADVFTASVVLAVMIIPTVSAIARETMSAVPRAQREAALAIGATPWETTRLAVLPYASSGIVGAIILGLGRALGETMAVTMTIGNNQIGLPPSLFSQGQTIASGIATKFQEATPQEAGALIAAGLVLLGISLLVNIVARLLVRGVFRGGEAST